MDEREKLETLLAAIETAMSACDKLDDLRELDVVGSYLEGARTRTSDILYDRYPEERAIATANWDKKCADAKFVAAVQHVLRHQ